MKEELWKLIPGIKGYIVSNTGKVMVLPRLGNKLTGKIQTNGAFGKVLKPRKQYQGYWQVGLTIDSASIACSKSKLWVDKSL